MCCLAVLLFPQVLHWLCRISILSSRAATAAFDLDGPLLAVAKAWHWPSIGWKHRLRRVIVKNLVLFQPSVSSTWGDESAAPKNAGSLLQFGVDHTTWTRERRRELSSQTLQQEARKLRSSVLSAYRISFIPPFCCFSTVSVPK